MNEYIVSAEQDGMRLDVFLTEQMEGSRSYIQSLIKKISRKDTIFSLLLKTII